MNNTIFDFKNKSNNSDVYNSILDERNKFCRDYIDSLWNQHYKHYADSKFTSFEVCRFFFEFESDTIFDRLKA